MATPMDDRLEPLKVGMREPESMRPPTLMQRISSGLFAIMPTRAQRPTTDPVHRSLTAPVPTSHGSIWSRLRQRESHQVLRPRLNISALEGRTSTPCSYDSSTYFSFPSIEDESCKLCGLFPYSRSTSRTQNRSQPCKHCRSRSSLSHIAFFRRPQSYTQNRSTSAVPSTITRIFKAFPSPETGPRIVSPPRASPRLGNLPRDAALPPSRIPSYNRLRLPTDSSPNTDRPPTRRSGNYALRPVSPRLHHASLIPGTSHHAYVHKREVERHLKALEDGAPSALRCTSGGEDEVATVFYGVTCLRSSGGGSGDDGIEQGTRDASTKKSDLESELARSSVYQRRHPHPHPHHPLRRSEMDIDTDSPLSTLTTQTPSTLRGVHLELKGGGTFPRLRGGAIGLEVRRWVLTCALGREDEDEGECVQPARVVSGVREREFGRVKMPTVLRKNKDFSTKAETAPETAGTSSTHQTSVPISRSHTHISNAIRGYLLAPTQPIPIPTLRGGSCPSPTRLPPTLYWLAGGRGKRPVTVKAWKQQKGGKKRFGGLFGLAVSGVRGMGGYESGEERSGGNRDRSGDRDGDGEGSRSRGRSTRRDEDVIAEEPIVPSVEEIDGATEGEEVAGDANDIAGSGGKKAES